MSRMLFGIFLGLAFSFAQDGSVHGDFHVEGLVVIGPFFTAELICDTLLAFALTNSRTASYNLFRNCRFLPVPDSLSSDEG